MSDIIQKLKLKTEELLILKWKISQEEAKKLSYDFSLLLSLFHKEILVFPIIAKKKGISVSTIFYSLVICCKCSLSEEEGVPISTGIIISNFMEISNILPEKFEILIPQNIHISNWNEIRKYCIFVDGQTSAFIVNKITGYIEGAKNINKIDLNIFRAYSLITDKLNDTIAFVIIKGRKCFRIYSDGMMIHHLILIRKYGEWKSRNLTKYIDVISSLATEKSINVKALHAIFSASIRISELGLGAAFYIGSHKEIQSYITSARALETPKKYNEMTDEQLIRNVTSDGAVLVTSSGEIQSVETKFRAAGGRIASMIEITSNAPNSIGLVISQDGVISLIEKGVVVAEF